MITWKNYYRKKILMVGSQALTPGLKLQQVISDKEHKFLEIVDYSEIDLNQYKKSFIKLCVGGFTRENYQKKKQEIVSSLVQNYSEAFRNVKVVLENIKIKFHQSCFFLLSNYFCRKKDFLIFYILYFNFSSSNTNLHITDSSGKSKIFYSAGLLNFKGKQKIARRLVLIRLFNLLSLLKLKLIKKFPIAVHLKNVGSNKFLIVKKLKRTFFIKIIKTFELNAYNGCRKKKSRRKRQKKKKPERWLSGLKRQIVNLLRFLVIGSNPILFILFLKYIYIFISKHGAVGSVLVLGTRGHVFKSHCFEKVY